MKVMNVKEKRDMRRRKENDTKWRCEIQYRCIKDE